MISGGYDSDNKEIFVGMADFYPGEVHLYSNSYWECSYIDWKTPNRTQNFAILVCDKEWIYEWIPIENCHDYYSSALPVWETSKGMSFVGRTVYSKGNVIGSIYAQDKILYIQVLGELKLINSSVEILCMKPKTGFHNIDTCPFRLIRPTTRP